MRLEEIVPKIALTGLEPNAVVTVLAVNRINDDALRVFYQTLTTEGCTVVKACDFFAIANEDEANRHAVKGNTGGLGFKHRE